MHMLISHQFADKLKKTVTSERLDVYQHKMFEQQWGNCKHCKKKRMENHNKNFLMENKTMEGIY